MSRPSTTGSLLVARPDLTDPQFERSVVYVLDHGPDGAIGFILNMPLGMDVATEIELGGLQLTDPVDIFDGGPVESTSIIAVGGDPGAVPRLIDFDELRNGADRPPLIRLFAGYSGWAAGQLDAELASESWFVVPARHSGDHSDDIFGTSPDGLWRSVLGRQPSPLRALALFPEDLSSN